MKCSRLLIQCKVTDITNKPTDNSYKLNQDISPVTLCDFFPRSAVHIDFCCEHLILKSTVIRVLKQCS